MDRNRRLALSLAGGVVLTLLTGLVPLRTLMGATHYGLPMAWLVRRVLAPEFFPWRLEPLGLVVDLLVWTVVALAVIVAVERFRGTGAGDASTA